MTTTNNPVDPNRLTVDQAAKLLSAAARQQVSAEQIAKDVKNGAPTNPDGTLNLVHYTAWMLMELKQRGD